MLTSAQILATKAQNLSRVRSTVRSDFLVQTAHNRGWSKDTAQPLPAYPAPGAGPVEIARYVVPAGMQGALTALAIVHLGAAGSYLDGSGVLLWHVMVNGGPVKGLENIYAQIGTLSQPQAMAMMLTQNDVLQILVEVPAGKVAPAGNPYARLSGWLDYGGSSIVLPAVGRGAGSGTAEGTGATSTSPTSTSTSTTSPALSPSSGPTSSGGGSLRTASTL